MYRYRVVQFFRDYFPKQKSYSTFTAEIVLKLADFRGRQLWRNQGNDAAFCDVTVGIRLALLSALYL